MQRYSPSTKINTKNVKDLVPAWSFSFGGEKQRGQQSQPVVHNGKMFVTGSYSRAFALDAKTGKKLWEYNHRLPEGILPCCDVINRGGALYENLFIFGTLDSQLVALDQDTGKVVWKEKVGDYADGYSITNAPVIAKGLVITGMAGGEFGVVGRVQAHDAKTGKLVWMRPTVEGHMGFKDGKENGISGTTNATWPGDLWKTGGATPWMGCSYDPETNLVYCGTGNPGPWNSLSASRRQPFLLLDRGDRCRHGQDRLAFPAHTERRLGFRRDDRAHSLYGQGRQETHRQAGQEWLLLRAGCEDRQIRAWLPLRQEDYLGLRTR